jgi:oligopeptidase B
MEKKSIICLSKAYTAHATSNVDFDTDILRYAYQSMATPASIIDFNMKTREKVIRKEQEVLGGSFDKDNYIEERVWAAKDGTQVPISMVYKKGLIKDGENPLLLYAYGSYGHSMDAYFSSTRLSLLDRGFVYAIAHIRGGEDLGRQWYEGGKLLKKEKYV